RDFHVTGVQTCALPISRLEDVVDERRQAVDVLEHHPAELLALRRVELGPAERLETELQGRERALELVRHRIDEAVLASYLEDLPREIDAEDDDHRHDDDAGERAEDEQADHAADVLRARNTLGAE